MAQITLRDAGRQLTARITDSLPQSEAGGGRSSFVWKSTIRIDPAARMWLTWGCLSACRPRSRYVGRIGDSGAHARVYVAHGENVFEPREVETGWRFGEQVEIRHGVEPGERVVVAATFLVDSESRLKTQRATSTGARDRQNGRHARTDGGGKMVTDPSCGMQVDAAKAAASGNTLVSGGATTTFVPRSANRSSRTIPRLGQAPGGVTMINRIIDFSVAHKLAVIVLTVGACIAGWWAMMTLPLDATPD